MATKRKEPTPWWLWLDEQLRAQGITAAELERRSNGEITSATISYWKAGPHSAAADKAIRVAEVLGAEPAEALRAAGHKSIADLVGSGSARVDPMITEIMGMKHLGMKVRQALITQYLADQEEARRRARQMAKTWAQVDDDDDDDEFSNGSAA